MPAKQCRKAAKAASVLTVILVAAAAGGAAWAGASGPATIHASQKGQSFQPGELIIRRGDTVQIINDDGELLHHAYVDSPTFSFDSGDQAPGEQVDIVFKKAGTFNVLCGIHPKMKMRVQAN